MCTSVILDLQWFINSNQEQEDNQLDSNDHNNNDNNAVERI